MTSWAQDAFDALDALGDSPTPDEARRVTDRFEDTDLMAALAAHGGGGGGGGETATVTLTDAQIKDLINTYVELVPAPGADKVLLINWAIAILTTPGEDAYLYDDGGDSAWRIIYSATPPFSPATGDISLLIGGSGGEVGSGANLNKLYRFPVPLTSIVGSSIVTSGLGSLDGLANQPLVLADYNGGTDPSGGDPANTLEVRVNYLTLDV